MNTDSIYYDGEAQLGKPDICIVLSNAKIKLSCFSEQVYADPRFTAHYTKHPYLIYSKRLFCIDGMQYNRVHFFPVVCLLC